MIQRDVVIRERGCAPPGQPARQSVAREAGWSIGYGGHVRCDASVSHHPVVRALADRDPLPDAWVSSYWAHFGRLAQVTCDGTSLAIRPAGYRGLQRASLFGNWLARKERDSFPQIESGPAFPELWTRAQQLAGQLGATAGLLAWQSAHALSLLTVHVEEPPRSFLIIGDGCGFAGALARGWWPDARLILLDLPRQLMAQATLHLALGHNVGAAGSDESIWCVTPDDIGHIDRIDACFSMACFQELPIAVIAEYFQLLRSRHARHFYCVSRERKVLPGGEVIAIQDYPWSDADRTLIDGPCPFFTHSYGVRAGWPPIGVRAFEGRMWHRLAHLAPA